jgi:peptidoglycan/LPS O-acetylase OafA/YrhL
VRQLDFIPSLAGLRGIAALTVAIAHMRIMTGEPVAEISPALGVVLFFVLSGFLMTHLYLHQANTPRNLLRFALARFGRVYPLFAVVVVGAVIISSLNADNSAPYGLSLGDLLPHLLLYGEGGTIWTVAVEFQFYGIFLLLWAMTGALPGQWRDVAFGAIALFLVIFCLWLEVTEGRNTSWRYLHMFFAGALAALALRWLSERMRTIVQWLVVPCLVYYGFSYFKIPYYEPAPVYGDARLVLMTALLVLSTAAAKPDFSVSRVLGSRPMVFLGEVSFGIYLLHRWVMFYWEMLVADLITGWPLLFIFLCLTISLAWVAHLLIERPCRDLVRRWSAMALAPKVDVERQSAEKLTSAR